MKREFDRGFTSYRGKQSPEKNWMLRPNWDRTTDPVHRP